MIFHANVVRENEWWVVTVPDVGATQGRTYKEAKDMTIDLIVAMLKMDPPDIQVYMKFGSMESQ